MSKLKTNSLILLTLSILLIGVVQAQEDDVVDIGENDTTLNIDRHQVEPIVRVNPQYPLMAARDGIEGWVRLMFTINEEGGVEDIQVIEAEPKRVFDREAKKALNQWKYKPKYIDGKVLKQTNMYVQLDFRLE